MGDYDPTAEFEVGKILQTRKSFIEHLRQTIQNPTAVQYAAADIHSHPMSTPSPSGPYYASGLIYLTEDHAVGALPVPAVCTMIPFVLYSDSEAFHRQTSTMTSGQSSGM